MSAPTFSVTMTDDEFEDLRLAVLARLLWLDQMELEATDRPGMFREKRERLDASWRKVWEPRMRAKQAMAGRGRT